MLEIISLLIFAAFSFVSFNYLMGYREKTISFTPDDRHTGMTNIGKAAEKKLQDDGRDAAYIGNGYCRVDGKVYEVSERTIPMSGIPMQRIILTKTKKSPQDEA